LHKYPAIGIKRAKPVKDNLTDLSMQNQSLISETSSITKDWQMRAIIFINLCVIRKINVYLQTINFLSEKI